ncbi:MAG: hypothetical protein ACFE95_16120 [Candidatus Hodarchaeota archaeon]
MRVISNAFAIPSYKLVSTWFSLLGFADVFGSTNGELINSREWWELPASLRRIYFVYSNTTDTDIYTTPWRACFKELFELVTSKKLPALRERIPSSLFRKLKESDKKITSSEMNWSTYIKYKAGLGKYDENKWICRKISLFRPKYDVDIVSSAIRMIFFEHIQKYPKAQAAAKLIQDFFTLHSDQWNASRLPLRSSDIRFIIMIDNFPKNLLDMYKLLIQNNNFDIAKKKKGLTFINKAYQTVQLVNAEILADFPFWYLTQACKSGSYQNWIERGNTIPETIDDLLIENGFGPVNHFIMGLFSNNIFRNALNNKKANRILKNFRIEYVGSYNQPILERPNLTTAFIPDIVSKAEDSLTQYLNMKIIGKASDLDVVVDILKSHNSLNQPYRTFQLNIYRYELIPNITHLNRKQNSSLTNLLKKYHANGVIVITKPTYIMGGLSRFSEIFNAARINFLEYKRVGKTPKNNQKIANDIVVKVNGFQKSVPITANHVIKFLKMFNFEASHECLFVKESFWNYIKEMLYFLSKSPNSSNKIVSHY